MVEKKSFLLKSDEVMAVPPLLHTPGCQTLTGQTNFNQISAGYSRPHQAWNQTNPCFSTNFSSRNPK